MGHFNFLSQSYIYILFQNISLVFCSARYISGPRYQASQSGAAFAKTGTDCLEKSRV